MIAVYCPDLRVVEVTQRLRDRHWFRNIISIERGNDFPPRLGESKV